MDANKSVVSFGPHARIPNDLRIFDQVFHAFGQHSNKLCPPRREHRPSEKKRIHSEFSRSAHTHIHTNKQTTTKKLDKEKKRIVTEKNNSYETVVERQVNGL